MFGHTVDANERERGLGVFLAEQQESNKAPAHASTVLAVNGKTVRGAIPRGQTRGAHLVAAYLVEQGVVLDCEAVEQ